jgi:hypothetical protein
MFNAILFVKYHHFFFLFLSGKSKTDFAFNVLTTFLPVFSSSSFLATCATLPPCFATFLLSSKSFGLTAYEISLVGASASIFKISSVLVMLSRRFSFLSPFRILYSLVVLSAHALMIISVQEEEAD